MLVRNNHLIALVVLAAVALASSLLVLVAAGKPAQASFEGTEGLIAFVSDRDTPIDPTTGKPFLRDPERPNSYILNDDIYVTTERDAESDSEPLRLTKNPAVDQFPTVSPNGKEIAFQSNRDGNTEIYVMEAKDDDGDGEGDNLRRLTNNAASDAQPAWSPGGQKIAFQSTRDGSGSEIYIMDAEDKVKNVTGDLGRDGNGDDTTRLTEAPGFDNFPVFSPDGSRIAFTSFRDVGGNGEIYAMDAEDKDGDRNGDNPTRLTNDPARDTMPEFSPEGTNKIVFASNRVPSGTPRVIGTTPILDIWVMGANGDNPSNLTNEPDKNHQWPTWSPDGSKIAFWRGSDSGLSGLTSDADSDIWVMDANGGNRNNLTEKSIFVGNPDLLAGDVMPDWGELGFRKVHGE